jgi:hypothetical protein
MSNAGYYQTNSSGPAGGSGHVHHLEMTECGLPPSAKGYKTGQLARNRGPACRRWFAR